jgi:outer membrane biosynthesis protein TonB
MPGQGQLAESAKVTVTNDETIENKALVDDVEVVTIEDKDSKAINKAALTTKSTSIEDSGMEPQEVVVAPVIAEIPASATMEKKETPPPKKETPAPKKETPAPKKETPAPKKETPAPKKETPAPKKETPAPKKETPAPKKVLDPIVDVPIKKALKKSQDLMHEFDVKAKHEGMCVGYFTVEGTDAQVLAACAKAPDNTCPVSFNADSCVALKPVNVDVTKGAKVMMF